MRSTADIASDLNDAALDSWRAHHLARIAIDADDEEGNTVALEVIAELTGRVNSRVCGLAGELQRLNTTPKRKAVAK